MNAENSATQAPMPLIQRRPDSEDVVGSDVVMVTPQRAHSRSATAGAWRRSQSWVYGEARPEGVKGRGSRIKKASRRAGQRAASRVNAGRRTARPRRSRWLRALAHRAKTSGMEPGRSARVPGDMQAELYSTLTPWYALLDAVEDHEAEVAEFLQGFEAAITGPRETLLELGAGAGNNAAFAKRAFHCTLADISEPMLQLSRAQNPECAHVLGDMRTLRLGRTFDAVLVHDSIVYMRTELELRAALATAFVHTRPGGAAILAPDCFQEDFHEYSQLHEGELGERSLRCLEWSWDPDPTDSSYVVEYAFLLRESGHVRCVHDTHHEGLFEFSTWSRLIQETGFELEILHRQLEGVDPASQDVYSDQVFLCRRPWR